MTEKKNIAEQKKLEFSDEEVLDNSALPTSKTNQVIPALMTPNKLENRNYIQKTSTII